MGRSYEDDVHDNLKQGQGGMDKLDIPILKYFWQSGPFTSAKNDNIPRFLRKIDVLKGFTDYELRVLSRFLHLRQFGHQQVIFTQGQMGIGFYLIYSGHVDIIVERDQIEGDDAPKSELIITLDKFEYFGELALLQENSIRNATAISKESCVLIGIFRPDIDELINEYPVMAAKFLQSISVIIANRLFSVTNEIRRLKHKISVLEANK